MSEVWILFAYDSFREAEDVVAVYSDREKAEAAKAAAVAGDLPVPGIVDEYKIRNWDVE